MRSTSVKLHETYWIVPELHNLADSTKQVILFAPSDLGLIVDTIVTEFYLAPLIRPIPKFRLALSD